MTTLSSDESLYRNYLKADFGHLPLDQITRQQVQLMHTKLRTEKSWHLQRRTTGLN
jgi:hypothetical protein